MWRVHLVGSILAMVAASLLIEDRLRYDSLLDHNPILIFGWIGPSVPDWIRKYRIRSILNAPCAILDDCEQFKTHGVERILGVNIVDFKKEAHIVGDLCTWKPDGEWDAVYINCFFCTSNDSKIGDHTMAARNITSWPVKYIIIYDTPGYEWREEFENAGWKVIESWDGKDVGAGTRVEMWGRAA